MEKKDEIDDEAVIGSDLDDSDDDDNLAGIGDDPVNGAKDIVFCTYDKVRRAHKCGVFCSLTILRRASGSACEE